MDVDEHFRIIWSRKLWILLASLLVAAGVYAFRAQAPDQFQSTSSLKVIPGEEADGRTPEKEGTIFLAETYANLAQTAPVLDSALELAGLDISRSKARARSTATASRTIGRITLRTTGPTPEAAQALNEALGQAIGEAVRTEQIGLLDEAIQPLQDEIKTLQAQLAALPEDDDEERAFIRQQIRDRQSEISARRTQAPNSVRISNEAGLDPTPFAPRPQRDATLALVVALLLNSEIAVALTYFSDRLGSERDIERALTQLGLPVLARIPEGSYDVNVIESFRELRTALLFMQTDTIRRRFAVVSSDPGVGKSFVSIRLAESLAAAGLKTVLVDADLRAPSVHELLGVPRAPGLTDALRASDNVPDFHELLDGSLRVLTAGRPVDDPAGMLAQDRFAGVLAWTEEADIVLCDTPPVRFFADPIAVASRCDGFIYVLDVEQTRRSELETAVNRLRQLGAEPVGAVLNRADVLDRRAYAAEAARRRFGRKGKTTQAAE